ncbi:LysR family transcriptional regulator [Bryobacter aggregatus]|uniref:LysR family transcriptional regulator n=1 Tax=Bryobacter aggregatus TaxID=360054 RepID=UPI0004E0D1EB|nr:LysR substrate-binding domain-containing protein [Bryobacter aggregatus]
MEFQQLRYFLAVARTGSFVRAADQEGIAQPSLSQQIRKLERELGVSLFDRLGRSVRLTTYGEKLVEQSERILFQMDEARAAIETLKGEDSGDLKVGVIPTVLPYALVKPISNFQQRFPKANVILSEGTTANLVEHLRRGEIDVAILALPIKHAEIVCSELFREPLLAAVPLDHCLANSTKIDLSRLGIERMLLLKEGHCLREDVLTACTKAKAQFQQIFESDHLESILRLVAEGYGLSLVPDRAAEGRTDCRFVPFEPTAVRRIGYALAKGRQATPIRASFIRHLKQWDWKK